MKSINQLKKKEEIYRFKQIVKNTKIYYNSIYLFGSRAKGLETKESDFDFLIVSQNKIPNNFKRILRAKIRITFHDFFPTFPIDIIIYDNDFFSQAKQNINSLSYEVYNEGIRI